MNLQTWAHLDCPSPLVINDKDGSVLVYVPAGEFEMGDGEDRDCPEHTVYLDAYYIGIYTVTNAQYKRFVDETGHRPPDKADYGNAVWRGNDYPEGFSDHPVVCVSWEDARTYAEWAGLSLPTEGQWEKAARGPGNTKFPWGDQWDGGKCRHSENKGNATTCRAYDYSEGVSAYGCYNMSGNVLEWCADWYESEYCKNGDKRNPRGPSSGSYRVHRGGGWRGDAGHCRAALRHDYSPDFRSDSQGFRLVRSVF
jgi:formylglycine-generating enzyme